MHDVYGCNILSYMIIFDASTLILLAKIEALELFLEHSSLGAAIPEEVERECRAIGRSLDALMIQKAIEEAKIKVASVKNRKYAARLRADFSLGKGESEAICMALAEKASVVGIDDKNGINACKLLGLPFTTAIGIVIRLREKRLFTADAALAELAMLATFGRYKKSILDDARKKLEETA